MTRNCRLAFRYELLSVAYNPSQPSREAAPLITVTEPHELAGSTLALQYMSLEPPSQVQLRLKAVTAVVTVCLTAGLLT